jgi:hypothetical protein
MDQLTELYRNKVLDLQKKIALLENQLSLMEDDRVSRGKDVIAAQTQEAQRIGMGIPSKEAQEKEAKKREEFDKDIRKQSMLVAAEQEKITGKYDREDPSVKQQALLRVLMDKPELSDLVPEQEYVKLTGSLTSPLVLTKGKTGRIEHQGFLPDMEDVEARQSMLQGPTPEGGNVADYMKVVTPAHKAFKDQSEWQKFVTKTAEAAKDPESIKTALGMAIPFGVARKAGQLALTPVVKSLEAAAAKAGAGTAAKTAATVAATAAKAAPDVALLGYGGYEVGKGIAAEREAAEKGQKVTTWQETIGKLVPGLVYGAPGFAVGQGAFGTVGAAGRVRGTFSGRPAGAPEPEVSPKPTKAPAVEAKPEVSPKPAKTSGAILTLADIKDMVTDPLAYIRRSAEARRLSQPKPEVGAEFGKPPQWRPDRAPTAEQDIPLTATVKPRVRVGKGMFGEPKIELVDYPIPGEVSPPPSVSVGTSPKPSAAPSPAKAVGVAATLPAVEAGVRAPLPAEIPSVPAMVARMTGEAAPEPTITTAKPAVEVPAAPSRSPAKPATPAPRGGGLPTAPVTTPSAPSAVAPSTAPETKGQEKAPEPTATKAKEETKAEQEARVPATKDETTIKATDQIPAKVPEQIPSQVTDTTVTQAAAVAAAAAAGGPPNVPPKVVPSPPKPPSPQRTPPKKPGRGNIPFFDTGREGGGAMKGPEGQVARLDLGLAADALGKYSKYYRIA